MQMDEDAKWTPLGLFETSYLAFLETITSLRPSLHGYCPRMTGSVLDGEDKLLPRICWPSAMARFHIDARIRVPSNSTEIPQIHLTSYQIWPLKEAPQAWGSVAMTRIGIMTHQPASDTDQE
jgi:hypothetical protein